MTEKTIANNLFKSYKLLFSITDDDKDSLLNDVKEDIQSAIQEFRAEYQDAFTNEQQSYIDNANKETKNIKDIDRAVIARTMYDAILPLRKIEFNETLDCAGDAGFCVENADDNLYQIIEHYADCYTLKEQKRINLDEYFEDNE